MNNIKDIENILNKLAIEPGIRNLLSNLLGDIVKEIEEKNQIIQDKSGEYKELYEMYSRLLDKNNTYKKMISSIIDSDDILGMR